MDKPFEWPAGLQHLERVLARTSLVDYLSHFSMISKTINSSR